MAEPQVVSTSIRGSGIADQPSDTDDLGFEPYVLAIAEFLTSENTRGPLTLSIEGEWGTGKSSFMMLLHKELKRTDALTVNFNAWRHDKEDALWAAFALKFVRDLSEDMSWWNRTKAKVKLNWHRYDWESGWFKFLFLALSVVLFAVLTVLLIIHFWNTGFNQIAEIAKKEGEASLVTHVFLAGGVAGYAVLSVYLIKKLKDLFVNPLSTDLKRYMDKPDYKGHAAFIEDFHRDFKLIVETYVGGNKSTKAESGKEARKVYVFIDDLDRCEVPKAAELMQALNLMISDIPHLVFIIGMDREKVAAGLAVKYEKLLPYLAPSSAQTQASSSVDAIRGLEYGYTFIEKFIQLPFKVPQPSPDNIPRFLDAINNDAASSQTTLAEQRPDLVEIVNDRDAQVVKDIVLKVAAALDYNPRRIKQFINVFRLRTHIASRTGLFATPESTTTQKVVPLTLERLGKFVAITLRWPLLAADLSADLKLLDKLQEIAWGGRSAGSNDTRLSRWASKPKLIKLLQEGLTLDVVQREANGFDEKHILPESDPDRQKYALIDMDINKLIQISPSRRQQQQQSPSETADKLTDFQPTTSKPRMRPSVKGRK
jgi:hypothetical protein